MRAVVSQLALASLVLACGTPRADGAALERSGEQAAERSAEPTAAERSEPSSADLGSAAAEPQAGERGPWTAELRVESAPFDEPRAPSVLVHAPPAFDPARRPLRLVVFLHGWSGCARVLVHEGPTPCRDGERPHDGWGLAGRHDAAGTDALFVVPQLAFMQRDGSPGRFFERARFRAFLEEVLAALAPRLGPASLADIEPITLLAHSAGFETALALLSRGGVEVRNVVLFDALYRGVEPFATWVAQEPERRLVSLYTGTARTARQNELLEARGRSLLPSGTVASDLSGALPGADPPSPLVEAVRAHRLVVARSPVGHGSVPSRHLPDLLGALDLSVRP